MLATLVSLLTAGMLTVGVVNEVLLPVGERAIDEATWLGNQAYARIEQALE